MWLYLARACSATYIQTLFNTDIKKITFEILVLHYIYYTVLQPNYPSEFSFNFYYQHSLLKPLTHISYSRAKGAQQRSSRSSSGIHAKTALIQKHIQQVHHKINRQLHHYTAHRTLSIYATSANFFYSMHGDYLRLVWLFGHTTYPTQPKILVVASDTM